VRAGLVLCAAAVFTAALLPARGEPARGTAASVPILMYHVIGPVVRGAPYPDLYVSRRDFAAQMSWLARRRFHAVTLKRVYDAWHGRGTLPRRPVVVSFDDGYRTQFTNAFPILRSHRWPGVENLEVNNEHRPWGLSLSRVRALVRAGWEIDAHTISHPDLTTLDPAALEREVAGSRRILRRQLHVPVSFFCYPAGRYDAAVIAAVRRAGYLGATTTNYGLATPTDLYTLKRVRVNGSDGLAGFASKLRSL
jgi:peptidoglycan/xylan/chitin deacetylase (PgdA/CDA1 family)